MLALRKAWAALAVAAEHRTRGLQHRLVDEALVLVEGGVDARELLLDEHVAAAPFAGAEPLVVRILEGLEGPHQFAVRHHGVGRNARLGLELVVHLHIHVCLLVSGIELKPHAHAFMARRIGLVRCERNRP